MANDPSDLRLQLRRVRDLARSSARSFIEVARTADEAERIAAWFEDDLTPQLGQPLSQSSTYTTVTPVMASNLSQAEALIRASAEQAAQAQLAVGFVNASLSTTASGAAASYVIRRGDSGILAGLKAIDRGAAQSDLDARLDSLDSTGRLSERRRSAWIAYHLGTEESAAQACHSMREILTQLLDDWASPRDVKTASWWREEPASPNGVSKRQKVRYFIAGAASNVTDAEISALDSVVQSALDAHGDAIGIAHGRVVPLDVAFAVLTSMEGAMASLLQQRRKWSR